MDIKNVIKKLRFKIAIWILPKGPPISIMIVGKGGGGGGSGMSYKELGEQSQTTISLASGDTTGRGEPSHAAPGLKGEDNA